MLSLEKKYKLAQSLKKFGDTTGDSIVIANLIKELKTISNSFDLSTVENELDFLKERLLQFEKTIAYITTLNNKIQQIVSEKPDTTKLTRTISEKLIGEIKSIKKELLEEIESVRFLSLQKHGGNANRRIRVEGADVLTRYTDINFRGATSSVLATNNDTTKEVDITFPSGGASVHPAEVLTGTQVGVNVTLDLTQLSYTYTTVLMVFRNGVAVTPGASGWTQAGDIITVRSASASNTFQVLTT